jgi:hypothetical protein
MNRKKRRWDRARVWKIVIQTILIAGESNRLQIPAFSVDSLAN